MLYVVVANITQQYEALPLATLERAVCVKFVPAHDSIPAQLRTGSKVRSRYNGLVNYRREMKIPESARTIMSYTDTFTPLYSGDGCHFPDSTAAAIIKHIVDDAVTEIRGEAGSDVLPLVSVTGWNAEGSADKVNSRIEAVVSKQLAECRCVRDLLVLVAGFGAASTTHWRQVALNQQVLPRLVNPTPPPSVHTQICRFEVVRPGRSLGSVAQKSRAKPSERGSLYA